MRRKAILFASIPFANALSLANFQDITSILIPLTCQIVYDQQIPSCTVADFQQDGCSADCASSLTTIASSVSRACSNVNVNSNTLLGIVKDGGILQALCPTTQATTTTPPKATTTAIQQTAQPTIADSVTIPTASPGVVLGTTSSKSTPIAQSTISTTRRSSSSAIVSTTEAPPETTAAASSTTPQSEDGGIGGDPTTTVTQDEAPTSTSTTSKAASPTSNAKPQSDTGGGSPFDISSNDGGRMEGGSILAFVVASWACILLGR